MTKETLMQSPIFKEWVDGKVSIVHNTYAENKDISPAYIVIHSQKDKYTITRFFELGTKMHASVDYTDISAERVFELLLTEYSRGLA